MSTSVLARSLLRTAVRRNFTAGTAIRLASSVPPKVTFPKQPLKPAAAQTPKTPPIPSSSPSPSPKVPSPTPTPESASSKPSSSPASPPPVEEESTAPFDLSLLPSLDVDPGALPPSEVDQSQQGKGGKRAQSTRETAAQIGRRRRRNVALAIVFGWAAYLSLGLFAPWDEGEREKITKNPEPEGGDQFYERFRLRTMGLVDWVRKPAWETLLPEPIPPVRPYTLLVDLDDILIASSWDREHGWRVAKRPGVDYFIAYLSQFFEIVLFTSQPAYLAFPIAEKLDPYAAYMPYRLYREATRYTNGKYVKDLSYLNRDLKKVIMLETEKDSIADGQEGNAVVLPKWKPGTVGSEGDRGLVDLIPFLESIGIYQPADVRPILKAYEGKDVIQEYGKLEAARALKAQQEWEAKHPSGSGTSSHGLGLSISSLFGGQPNPAAQLSKPNGPPPSYIEQRRAMAQQAYREEQKYWKDNEKEIQKLIAEDRERQMKEAGGSLLSYLGQLGGAPPPPPADKADK